MKLTKGTLLALPAGHLNVGRWQFCWDWTEWFGLDFTRMDECSTWGRVYDLAWAAGPLELRRFRRFGGEFGPTDPPGGPSREPGVMVTMPADFDQALIRRTERSVWTALVVVGLVAGTSVAWLTPGAARMAIGGTIVLVVTVWTWATRIGGDLDGETEER